MRAAVPETWLNDAVKAWLSPRGTFDRYLERPHLQVFVAQPEYLLAMKAVALRLGEEFHDLDDVRYLLRYRNITCATEVLAIIGRYFDEPRIPVKTRLALEELSLLSSAPVASVPGTSWSPRSPGAVRCPRDGAA